MAKIKKFREPDDYFSAKDGTVKWATWYGPRGSEGDVATEVEKEVGGYIVSSYQHVAGLIDDYDTDFPFLKTSTWVDEEETSDIREAAFIGIERLDNQGGDEEMVAELPR